MSHGGPSAAKAGNIARMEENRASPFSSEASTDSSGGPNAIIVSQRRAPQSPVSKTAPTGKNIPSRIRNTGKEPKQTKPRARSRKPQQVEPLEPDDQLSQQPHQEASNPKKSLKVKEEAKELNLFENDENIDEEGFLDDPSRNRLLERNRIAATKCRLRKRKEASALSTREQATEDDNRHLSARLDSLTAEIYHLKTQLLLHTDCNCVLIQQYISNEAKRYVEESGENEASPYSQHEQPNSQFNGHENLRYPDSSTLPSQDGESFQSTWTTAFGQQYNTPITDDEMFHLAMKEHEQGYGAPGAMAHASPVVDAHHAAGYGDDPRMGMVTQQGPPDWTRWNAHNGSS